MLCHSSPGLKPGETKVLGPPGHGQCLGATRERGREDGVVVGGVPTGGLGPPWRPRCRTLMSPQAWVPHPAPRTLGADVGWGGNRPGHCGMDHGLSSPFLTPIQQGPALESCGFKVSSPPVSCSWGAWGLGRLGQRGSSSLPLAAAVPTGGPALQREDLARGQSWGTGCCRGLLPQGTEP